VVWEPERIARWQTSGYLPSPVMVRPPALARTFLEYAAEHARDLHPMLHLMTYRGPRRGEAFGVFDELHRLLLAKLNAANRIDWSRAAMDGSHVDAKDGVPGQARRRLTAANRVPSTI